LAERVRFGGGGSCGATGGTVSVDIIYPARNGAGTFSVAPTAAALALALGARAA
jgi:hypothetical protein